MSTVKKGFNNHSANDGPMGTAMALVVDMQSVERMEQVDARRFLGHLADTLERLRGNNVPVTWVTMRPDSRLFLPEEEEGARDLAQLVDMGFYGLQGSAEHAAILTDFLSQHGPRRNEAVFCKSFKSALIDAADVEKRPAYRAALSAEAGMDFAAAIPAQGNLADYMRGQGVRRTYIMGAVSSHCVAETAVSAAIKGFAPVVLTDCLLSWQGDEDKVDPKTGTQLWRGEMKGDDQGAGWNQFHHDKVQAKITAIAADKDRAFGPYEMARIGAIDLRVNGIRLPPATNTTPTPRRDIAV